MNRPASVPVALAVICALGDERLCAECIGARAGIPSAIVTAELDDMNVAPVRHGRPSLQVIFARCLRCEGARCVYRIHDDHA